MQTLQKFVEFGVSSFFLIYSRKVFSANDFISNCSLCLENGGSVNDVITIFRFEKHAQTKSTTESQ